MLNFVRRIFSSFYKIKWRPINEELIGKDSIFKMKFDKNWVCTIKGNSYYSIHNEIDDLKGGIQISIIWNRPVVKSIDDLEHLDTILKEREHVNTTRVQLSNMDAIHFSNKYIDNNMDFYFWYLRFDNVYFKISYFIYEEESLKIREEWLKRIKKIINTIEIERTKFTTVRMR